MSLFSQKRPSPFNLLTADQLKQWSTIPPHVIDAMNVDPEGVLSRCLVWVAFIDKVAHDAIMSINHENNRKLNKPNATAISVDVLRGKFNWQLGWLIFQNGKLIDGQTRVEGLGNADQLQPVLCIEFPPEEQIIDIIDANSRARSASDSDNFVGFEWPKHVAESFGTLNEFLNGGGTGRHAIAIVREALRPFFAEPLMKVYPLCRDNKFRSTTWLATTAALFKRHPGDVTTFVRNVVFNENCPRGSIAYKLREYILATTLTSDEKWPGACRIFNAFHTWLKHGTKLRQELSDDPTAFKDYLRGLVIDEGIPVISLNKDSAQQIVDKLSVIDPETCKPAHYTHLIRPPTA